MLITFSTAPVVKPGRPEKPKARLTKKWHHKTRSGCARCKLRRVKCDEEQPECLRCRRAGYQCRWELPQPKIFTIDDNLRFDKSGDRRFYDFFNNEGSGLLATFEPGLGNFWRFIPTLSTTWPPVQYALTALGALQAPLHYRVPDDVVVSMRHPQQSSTTLNYLCKSMRTLALADMTSMDPLVPLACCLCFIALTVWTEKTSTPVLHIDAGLNMIQAYRASKEADSSRQNDRLNIVMNPFMRLVVSACALADHYPTPKSGIPDNYLLDLDLGGSIKLFSYTEAFEDISTIIKCILRLHLGHTMEGIEAKVEHALSQYADALEELHERDVKTAYQRGHPETIDENDFLHLKIHHRMAHVMFHALKQHNELDFDLFNADFAFISECSREYIAQKQTLKLGHTGSLKPSLGIIPPLFFTATKCRDLTLRIQAIKMLHASAQNERSWTSCMATTLAKFVIYTEHGGRDLPGDTVPLAKRIALQGVFHNNQSRSSTVRYRYCIDYKELPSRVALLPFKPHPTVDCDGVIYPMHDKVLQAFGFTGVVLYSPRIFCHCPDGLNLDFASPTHLLHHLGQDSIRAD